MKVFVARIPTYYEVLAVSETPEGARKLASEKALAYLVSVDAAEAGVTDTAERVAEYFGVNVCELGMETAILIS
ncbi:hypothetical protein SEA_STEAMY_71 [Mycobacterium phage Steamy]|uniref:Uncharacterized protein n=1 Tax=Mycobacterium phage Steamy TaxID=2250309 RepID=A0A345L0P3_9CAUD|nr:hypothetical protein KIV62_gp30 [Mycobacterium phage Steamy]AXH48845.1 hypothetical protein SEA_STEAMY_71 [Mycobacterium phage Steamy]